MDLIEVQGGLGKWFKEKWVDVSRKTKSGKPALAKIVGVDEKEITLDMNHPLAGKDLKFEVELLEIVE